MYFKSIDVLHKVKEIYILSDFFMIIFLAFMRRIHVGLLNDKHIKIAWPNSVYMAGLFLGLPATPMPFNVFKNISKEELKKYFSLNFSELFTLNISLWLTLLCTGWGSDSTPPHPNHIFCNYSNYS